MMDVVKDTLIRYLTADFDYAPELYTFGMAFQGCMAVRNGRNLDKKMAWFHAFMLSVLTGFAGGSFVNVFMGKPTSMLSNDQPLVFCIIAFVLVNCTPFDIGYKVGNFLPVFLLTTCLGQLFRANGLVKFTAMGFEAFQQKPSDYYPVPVVGPVIFATLLGNMGGFFHKGLDNYLKNGMPWPFQNGLACASFYHFFIHDTTGVIGVNLRMIIDQAGPTLKMGLDDKTFAFVVVSAFMHITALLQLPSLLGASHSPFYSVFSKVEFLCPNVYSNTTKPAGEILLNKLTSKKSKKNKNKKEL